MPQNIIQFQVIPLGEGNHTIYALDSGGILWVKLGNVTPAAWRKVEG